MSVSSSWSFWMFFQIYKKDPILGEINRGVIVLESHMMCEGWFLIENLSTIFGLALIFYALHWLRFPWDRIEIFLRFADKKISWHLFSHLFIVDGHIFSLYFRFCYFYFGAEDLELNFPQEIEVEQTGFFIVIKFINTKLCQVIGSGIPIKIILIHYAIAYIIYNKWRPLFMLTLNFLFSNW